MKAMILRLSAGATTIIRRDHIHVLSTFHSYRIDSPPDKKRTLVDTISLALEIHAKLEEEIFYPAMRKFDAGVVEKSVPEHNEMRRLIARLREMQPEDPAFGGTVMELMRDVMRHVADEETILLPDAERVMGERLNDLGAGMTRRRFLTRTSAGLGLAALADLFGTSASAAPVPGLLGQTHFAPKAKAVIQLFMAGGPSHVDLFDHKPKLRELHGKDMPKSILGDQRVRGAVVIEREFRHQLAQHHQHVRAGLLGKCDVHVLGVQQHALDLSGDEAGQPPGRALRDELRIVGFEPARAQHLAAHQPVEAADAAGRRKALALQVRRGLHLGRHHVGLRRARRERPDLLAFQTSRDRHVRQI